MKSQVLMTVFLIIALGGMANAQTAWVLWDRHTHVDDNLQWEVKDAFPSYEKCKQAQQISCEQWRKIKDRINTNIDKLVESCPDSVVISYKDHSPLLEINYKCLPDTIDPRR